LQTKQAPVVSSGIVVCHYNINKRTTHNNRNSTTKKNQSGVTIQ